MARNPKSPDVEVESLPPPLPPWGTLESNVGASFALLARAFIERFPIGTQGDISQFDDWAIEIKALKAPTSRKRDSIAWKAHVCLRWDLRRNINRAAMRPKSQMDPPYKIKHIGKGMFKVISPQEEIHEHNAVSTDAICSLLKCLKRRLKRALQSAEWDQLPPWERILAESLWSRYESWEKRTALDATEFRNEITKMLERFTEGENPKRRKGKDYPLFPDREG
jgi:hypothetical protein